jgi:hypothetical protein
MTQRRWFVTGGFWFAVLYLIGLVLTTFDAIPSADEPLSLLQPYYADSGNRIPLLLGGILLALAAPALLAFVAAATVDPPEDRRTEASFARAAANLFAGCIGIGSMALALVAGELTFRTVPQPAADFERWLAELGYAVILVPGMAAAAGLLWALGRIRGPFVSLPLARAGYAVAVVSLAALPISIATGTLVWSQLPLCAWVACAAFAATR